ncbi:MlaD family protein [Williamsia deligens]|uniref:MlaD family protein n=1 Tax=Williamsia deligens TaxID=321325 RepID=A0ABW3G8Y0_9NOCA|nr:MlaD family protein [Williamsia deligens]MCP2192598.1 virulence factor Mce family protein [Williamsia deligens]
MRIGVKTSLALLVVVSVALAGYLAIGILKVRPFTSSNTVTVDMASSGGLLPRSRVLWNGIEVGTVKAIAIQPNGLRATLSIDSDYRIPASSSVTVENLSLVGEQYLNFSSTTAAGPWIGNGARLDKDVDARSTVGETLTNLQRLVGQVDPGRLESIARTVNAGWIGRDDDITRIGEFSQYLSRTITTQRTEFSDLFDTAQEFVRKADGIGPTLSEGSRQLLINQPPFTELWGLFPGLARATNGAVAWTQVISPFLQTLDDYLVRLLPKITPPIGVLLPLLSTVAPATQIDISSVVKRGLRIVDENGVVRFRVSTR